MLSHVVHLGISHLNKDNNNSNNDNIFYVATFMQKLRFKALYKRLYGSQYLRRDERIKRCNGFMAWECRRPARNTGLFIQQVASQHTRTYSKAIRNQSRHLHWLNYMYTAPSTIASSHGAPKSKGDKEKLPFGSYARKKHWADPWSVVTYAIWLYNCRSSPFQ